MSLENHLKRIADPPKRPRLGSQSSVKSDESKKDENTDSSQPSASSVPLIQRVAIVQKDEKGYGLTVSGDNPVYVQSVKPDGAAARAGVQKGDRIIKVNGTLVTNSNHIEVVKMIKSGSYVALTLLGKPQTIPPNRESSSDRESGLSRDSVMDRITNPQPVNAEKDREMKQQKLATLQNMYGAVLEECEKLRKSSRNSSGEKFLTQLHEKERMLKGLDAQIQNLQGLGPPDPNASPHLREVDANNTDTAPWLPGGPKHFKHSSMPASTMRPIQEVTGPTRYGNVARSKSDVSGRKMAVTQSVTTTDGQTYRRAESSPETSSVPTAVSDMGSMSDSPQNSPSTSPTPLHPQNVDMDTHPHDSGIDDGSISSVGTISGGSRTTHQIIGMDDDDFTSEDELPSDLERRQPKPVSPFLAKLQTLEMGDSKVFTDISVLENKPAHMAIFLHYILSQHDPSALLFYLMANYYNQAQGNTKDLKKWAYEIHSTFLVHQAPLRVKLDDSVVTAIDQTLQYKSEKEEPLRSIFNVARNIARNEVQELLSDFRQKKEKGLIHGAHELKDNMDKNEETRLIEQYLVPDLDRCFQPKKSLDDDSVPPDKYQAQGWAIATFLRNLGTKHPLHSSAAERSLSFIMKDKRGSKFLPRMNKSKSQKGHQFNLQHFQKVEFCMHCNGVLWGVGYQGYLCQSCEQCVHKHCLEDLEEQCAKKRKPRGQVPSIMPFRKSVPPTSGHGYGAVRLALTDIWNTATQFYTPVSESEKEVSSPTMVPSQTSTFNVQPLKEPEDKELNIFRETGHSVTQLVSKYEQAVIPESGTEGEKEQKSLRPSAFAKGRKGADLGRSESMKGRGDQRNDRPTRRSKSDVDMDDHMLKAALNASGSSSTSSLSNRSGESPVGSTDTLTQQIQEDSDFDVEPDLPSLKQVLGEEVVKKLKPKEKKRQDVINELFYTERSHLKNLKILDKLFYKPMMADPNISQEFTKSLFPNLETMIILHSSLNKSFKERRKEKSVVQSVGDLLLARFDGDAGENFRNGCAIFCRNQSHALENLKVRIRKDQRLAQLLGDAENNPLCQRLSLKDFIPRQMMRLTKYPLLIENLLKYTSTTGEEYANLERSHQCCKHILEYVNQAVKDCENHQRLIDLHKRIDKKIDNVSEMEDLKSFDIRDQTLVYDGSLTWRINNRKQIELHVVLMEKAMVLLQKQEDRLVLKCQNTQLVQGKDDAKRHSPLLWLNNVLARNDATDKRAFFVVNTSHSGPQIYQLVAATAEEQRKWTKLITQFSEMVKTRQIISTRNIPSTQQPTLAEEITVEREQMQRPSNQGPSEIDENLPPLESSLDLELIQPTDDTMTDHLANTVHMTPSAGEGVTDTIDLTVPIPMDRLREMSHRMNNILTNLLAQTRAASEPGASQSAVNSRDEERDRLRRELKIAQEELNKLRQIQKAAEPLINNLQARPQSFVSETSGVSDSIDENPEDEIQTDSSKLESDDQEAVAAEIEEAADENEETVYQKEELIVVKAKFELTSRTEAITEVIEENVAEKCQSLSEEEEVDEELEGSSGPVAQEILCEIEPPEEEELQDLEPPVIQFLDPKHCGESDTDNVETSKENGQTDVNIITNTSMENVEEVQLFQKLEGHIPSLMGGTCDNKAGSSTEDKKKQIENHLYEFHDTTSKLEGQEGNEEDDDSRYESSDDTVLGSEKDLELDPNQDIKVIETESRTSHDIDSLNSQNLENVSEISHCNSALRNERTVDGTYSEEGRDAQQTELSKNCGDIQGENAHNQTTDIDSFNEQISEGEGRNTSTEEPASEVKNATLECSGLEPHLCPPASTTDNSVTSEEATTSPVEI
ncbi:hypothetical protein CHS0354_025897 [Potamilus streckersoni]|uniref:Uncharacterized protein n=1 Tax=Potamilus streckersoni TaxID=2493646 RepID=A0AAE0TJ85_9BIVA|nr:hypothetical protein CHS0354_025897 [Potamilus streckersoni]